MKDRPASKELVLEDGFGLASLSGEAKVSTRGDVVGNPIINLDQKLIEIMFGDKPRTNYLAPFKVDGLD